jgi:hypothetical protein
VVLVACRPALATREYSFSKSDRNGLRQIDRLSRPRAWCPGLLLARLNKYPQSLLRSLEPVLPPVACHDHAGKRHRPRQAGGPLVWLAGAPGPSQVDVALAVGKKRSALANTRRVVRPVRRLPDAWIMRSLTQIDTAMGRAGTGGRGQGSHRFAGDACQWPWTTSGFACTTTR